MTKPYAEYAILFLLDRQERVACECQTSCCCEL